MYHSCFLSFPAPQYTPKYPATVSATFAHKPSLLTYPSQALDTLSFFFLRYQVELKPNKDTFLY
jgi:hypothetical protein